MMEMQVNMMIQRLADAESLQQQLEKENEGLRDQLSTLQVRLPLLMSCHDADPSSSPVMSCHVAFTL